MQSMMCKGLDMQHK